MAAITTTARGTDNIYSDRVVVPMSDKISELQPEASPLLVLTKKLNTKSTSNYKFEWMEDDLLGRNTAFAGTTETGTHGTSLAITTGTGVLVAVGDILKNTVTGEMVLVSAVSTDTLTVTRGYGETAATNMTNGDKLLIIANANMQGAGSPAEKYNNPSTVYNYTQIFRTPFSITRTLDKTALIGGPELARLRKKKGIEHAISIEMAFLFGERKLDTNGAQPLTTTRGLLKFLSASPNNVSKAKGSVVEADFDAFLEKLFYYGTSKEKIFLASPMLITKINSWAKGRLEIIQSDMDKTYGLNVMRYVSAFGALNIIQHPLLINAYDGYGIALDMNELSYRPLSDSDTRLKTNIQANDEDGQRDEYITEAGLELRLPALHGMFILTA